MVYGVLLAGALAASPARVIIVDIEAIEARFGLSSETPAPIAGDSGAQAQWQRQSDMLDALPQLIAAAAEKANADMAMRPATAKRLGIAADDATMAVSMALAEQFPEVR